jgi:hypothetical protein
LVCVRVLAALVSYPALCTRKYKADIMPRI